MAKRGANGVEAGAVDTGGEYNIRVFSDTGAIYNFSVYSSRAVARGKLAELAERYHCQLFGLDEFLLVDNGVNLIVRVVPADVQPEPQPAGVGLWQYREQVADNLRRSRGITDGLGTAEAERCIAELWRMYERLAAVQRAAYAVAHDSWELQRDTLGIMAPSVGKVSQLSTAACTLQTAARRGLALVANISEPMSELLRDLADTIQAAEAELAERRAAERQAGIL